MKVADCTVERTRERIARAPDIAKEIIAAAERNGDNPAAVSFGCALAITTMAQELGISAESVGLLLGNAWKVTEAAGKKRDEHAERTS